MERNKARFYNILYRVTLEEHERFNIGTYKEKKLHIVMKRYFEEDPTFHEIPTNGFIADIRRDDVITEIETGGFTGLKPKLAAYLPEYRVNLVYPLAAKKYISWIDPETHEIGPRRHSPKKANVYTAIADMIRILPFVKNENLTIVVPLLEMDEYRMLDGWSHDRKRGSNRYERIPTDLYELITLNSDEDYEKTIPFEKGEVFTVKEFAKGIHSDTETARRVIKVLEARGLLALVGKESRSYRYMRI